LSARCLNAETNSGVSAIPEALSASRNAAMKRLTAAPPAEPYRLSPARDTPRTTTDARLPLARSSFAFHNAVATS
jgi:hypothetical protein